MGKFVSVTLWVGCGWLFMVGCGADSGSVHGPDGSVDRDCAMPCAYDGAGSSPVTEAGVPYGSDAGGQMGMAKDGASGSDGHDERDAGERDGDVECTPHCGPGDRDPPDSGTDGETDDAGHAQDGGTASCPARGEVTCGGECRDAFAACGHCDNSCQDLVDAAFRGGLGPESASYACVEDRCYFSAIRFWDPTSGISDPPESCAHACNRAGMRCTHRRDLSGVVGVASYNRGQVVINIRDCQVVPSNLAPDPHQPNVSFFLTSLRCGCQQAP